MAGAGGRGSEEGAGGVVGVEGHSPGPQGGRGVGQEGPGGAAVHQEGLGGVAHAHALGLGVDDDRHGGGDVGGGVGVDVAVATAGLDDGHRGLLDDGPDEPGAAARDEDVDEAAGPHERGGPRPAGGVDGGDQVSRQGGVGQGPAQDVHNGGVGLLGGAPAAQHDGVAGLQGQGGHVDGHVGARLVDHAHHAQGNAHAAHPQAVGQGAAVDDLADRVGQARDLAQGVGDGPDALGRQGQAVDQARSHARGAGALQVGPVGGQDARGRLHEMVGHGAQPGVLDLAARPGHRSLGGASGASGASDQVGGLLLGRRGGGLTHGTTIRCRAAAGSANGYRITAWWRRMTLRGHSTVPPTA